MKNVEERPTRITNHSKTLIDLIVTNRKDLVKQQGTCPLGISDHDMIDAALSASIPRDSPTITIRNFNKFSERNFQSDIAHRVRLFKSAKLLMIPLMFITHGTCSSQNYAKNTHQLNKLKYPVTACLG